MRVAGLSHIDVPGIENFDCTEFVKGHMSYRSAMPRLLRELGWEVESDEFSEIEDPDPENHEKRQRELISEIEEARRELEKKQQTEKKRFSLFGRKKLAAKKDWELYDERAKGPAPINEDATLEDKATGVLFDIEAIQHEVADLAAQGIQVKQLESTLPPMRLTLNGSGPSNPYGSLRETKSFDESSVAATSTAAGSSSAATAAAASTAAIAVAATPVFASSPAARPPNGYSYDENEETEFAAHEGDISMTFNTSFNNSPVPERTQPYVAEKAEDTAPLERPSFHSAATAPAAPIILEHNAWADEDEFGPEKEIKMTFA